ncbi:MAG TPA: response regulator [Thermoanaerobaculia bacterium]|jgi:two-component system LytT family response regulator
MIDALIVDDEPLARRRIRQLLAPEQDFHVAGDCADGFSAVESITRHQPDVVFLDVQMPEISGLEVVEAIGVDRMPLTVFVTAFDRYAIDAFDRHALDYLLKPVEDRRFAHTLDRIRRLLGGNASTERPGMRAMAAERSGQPLDRILVRRGETLTFIRALDIDWVESIGNYVGIHAGTDKFVHRGTLSAFESRLDSRKFVRIHRGALVQIDRIREIQTLFGRGRVILRNGTELPLSRRCRQTLGKFEPAL